MGMTITPVGFNPRAGKTIELQHRPPEPDGSPMDPFAPLFLVAPDAVDSVRLYRNEPWYVFGVKSTDKDDIILVDGEVWYHTVSIDGGGGRNVIEGTFGYNRDLVTPPPPVFTPVVTNVQWALLESLNPHVQLDFRNWTGLSYVEAAHRVPPFYPVHTPHPNVGKPITEFINIPIDAELGVANFNDTAKFQFVPQPPNSIAFYPINLFLDNNTGGSIYITNDLRLPLHIHAIGTNGAQVLHADVATITVHGNGNINLQHSSSVAMTIDASAMTGSFVFSELSTHSVKIKAGSGSQNKVTTNCNSGDQIDFLKGHSGHGTYVPLMNFRNLVPPAPTYSSSVSGIDLTQDVVLDALAIKISNFIPTQDKIDFRHVFSPYPMALAVTHEDLNGQKTLKAAAELAAAHNARLGAQTINVFQYRGATYVFNDWSGDQKIDYGDGLIKLVGIGDAKVFVTPSEFIM
jgi:hypothetical protein